MWKEWFNFSRAERFGVLTLSVLLFLLMIAPYLHRLFSPPVKPLVDSQLYSQIDSFMLTLKQPAEWINQPFHFSDEEKPLQKEPEYFLFDPNTITTAQLIQLGLSAKQAQVIENYRAKGGLFRKPEDFGKMYVIDSKTFNKLEPYIQINRQDAERSNWQRTEYEPKAKPFHLESNSTAGIAQGPIHEKPKIELNTTDTLELVTIRGIGRSYARRIIAYRNLLGGYYSTDQLSEVYGLPSATIAQILPHIQVDSARIKQMNINLASYMELKQHPYINDYQAKAIIYYRETMGTFQSIHDIQKHRLIDSTTFNKLKPYISIY